MKFSQAALGWPRDGMALAFLLDKVFDAGQRFPSSCFTKCPSRRTPLQPGDMDQATFRRTIAFIRKHFEVFWAEPRNCSTLGAYRISSSHHI